MRARTDRAKGIVEKAVRQVKETAAATVGGGAQTGGGGGGQGGSFGGQSIQAADGTMKWMWGVSVFGGGDVFSEE